jgi:hypothetical protein
VAIPADANRPVPADRPACEGSPTYPKRLAIVVRMAERDDDIRNYLNFLADPSTAVDPAKVAAAQHAVNNATDLLDKARALSALEAARDVNGGDLRARFLISASGWARDNQITPGALRTLGVSNTDLAEAGLISRGTAGRKAGKVAGTARNRVSIPAVQAMIPTGRFTINDLIASTGASVATVRKAIDLDIAAGKVTALGPTTNHASRGRAPLQFDGK